MGGVFGKNKKPCVFPRVVYRARARKAARVCCDAATWTGESCFHSARIGRALRGSEPPAATLVLEASGSESREEEEDPATPARAQHSKASVPAAAGDTPEAELSQEPESSPELMKHQELTGEAQRSQNPQDSSEAEAALPGSSLSPKLRCGDRGVTPLSQTRVQVDVHVSAGDQGEPGWGQAAESELLSGAEQGAGSGAEDICVGKALWEVPVQKEGDTTAASCPLEEPELPLKAAEPGEGITNGQRAAQEQGGEEIQSPPDLQLGQGEIPVPEGVGGSSGEAERAEDVSEACADGETAEEIPACLPETQEEEKTKVSSEGKPEEL